MYRNVWIKYMNIKVTWGKSAGAGAPFRGRGQRRKWKQSFKIFSIHKNGRGLIHQSISASD